ncbi:MAG: phosphotransferase, partial [Polyangiaceae bacterium]
GQLSASASKELKQAAPNLPEPKASEFEQTNSTVVFGDELVLKIYRQVEVGKNPELELGEFLSRHKGHSTPSVYGALQLNGPGQEPRTLALVQRFTPNAGTAWQLTLSRLEAFFEEASAHGELAPAELSPGAWSALAQATPPPVISELAGPYLSQATLLGVRTAEVHLVLASGTEPAFAPESFSTLHQQSIYQRAHGGLVRTFEALRRRAAEMPPEIQPLVAQVLTREKAINERIRRITRSKIEATRTRCHGDLHLGQVLFTGDDFQLIDFEGEPARPLNERRYKRSPLRDAMGMIRSFNYATEAVLRSGRFRTEDVARLIPWASAWQTHVTGAFLRGYLRAAGEASFIPKSAAVLDELLDFYELEKVIYEVGYELDNRPDWLKLPLLGIESIFTRVKEAE